MAIPTPTIPSSISPVSAVRLNPTTNNRAFTSIVDLYQQIIQKRQCYQLMILVNVIFCFCMNPILTSLGADNMTIKVKNNGEIIYQTIYDTQRSTDITYPQHFIIPANTNIEITFTNSDSSSHNVGVSCYGYYMEVM